MLIELLNLRGFLPFDKLKLLDLDELEKAYLLGKPKEVVSEKASTAKDSAKPKPKAPAKTPAKKVSAPVPRETSVSVGCLHRPIFSNTLLGQMDGLACQSSATSQRPV